MEPAIDDGTTSGDAPGSICPQGWTLPPNAGDGSYNNLLKTIYNVGSSGSKLVAAPFDSAYTGYYAYLSGALSETSYGFYWSRTAKDASNAYYLVFFSGAVNPQLNSSRGHGFPVRCVRKTYASSFLAQLALNS